MRLREIESKIIYKFCGEKSDIEVYLPQAWCMQQPNNKPDSSSVGSQTENRASQTSVRVQWARRQSFVGNSHRSVGHISLSGHQASINQTHQSVKYWSINQSHKSITVFSHITPNHSVSQTVCYRHSSVAISLSHRSYIGTRNAPPTFSVSRVFSVSQSCACTQSLDHLCQLVTRSPR